jgi:hypothetical protein
MIEPGSGIRTQERVFPDMNTGVVMFLFARSIAGPFAALTVSTLLVVLDPLFSAGVL